MGLDVTVHDTLGVTEVQSLNEGNRQDSQLLQSERLAEGRKTHLQELQDIVSDVKVGELGIQNLEIDVLRGQPCNQHR